MIHETFQRQSNLFIALSTEERKIAHRTSIPSIKPGIIKIRRKAPNKKENVTIWTEVLRL